MLQCSKYSRLFSSVAGGGAGGTDGAGGGGAGGYRESSGTASGSYTASPLGCSVNSLQYSYKIIQLQ